MDKEEFRRRRKALGIKQYQFAEETGVHKNTVNRWEKGEYPLPLWAAKFIIHLEEKEAVE